MILLEEHPPLILAEVKTVLAHRPSDIFVVAVDVWIGIALLVSSPRRESSPAYAVAKEVMSIRIWGIPFLILGVIAAAALWCRRTHRFQAFSFLADMSRTIGPALYAFWSITFLIAALTESSASFVAVGAYLYLAYRHSRCPVPGR